MEIQLWREILTPYDLAVKELIVKFEHLIIEHHNQGLYSPIEQVTGRVKTVASILDKAQKKNIPVDEIEEKLPRLSNFVVPGENRISALCHVCSSITRRAERQIYALDKVVPVSVEIKKYINRLSDYLFVLARKLNMQSGIDEKKL